MKRYFCYPIVLSPPSIVRSKIFMYWSESILKLVKHKVKLTLTVIIHVHYLKVFQYLIIFVGFLQLGNLVYKCIKGKNTKKKLQALYKY